MEQDRDEVKLNLGAGDHHIPGYVSVDRKYGQEVYPLAYEDESVDEIRASHVLEHFSHREVSDVVADWVRVLRPGGRIRIAVPDFLKVANEYVSGKPINVQGFVMGGHVDNNDHHGTIFDRGALVEMLLHLGLEEIREWQDDVRDCSSLPISLNIEARKPFGTEMVVQNTIACISSARVGYALHHKCAHHIFPTLGIPYKMGIGCFWHQVLSEQIEQAISNPACKYVITCDFDTVFSKEDVLNLYRLMEAIPDDTDAIASVQSKRGGEHALFTRTDDKGAIQSKAYRSDFRKHLTPIDTAHFGLTIFRADGLRNLPRPWMCPKPNAQGYWRDGQTDADIDFWRNWRNAGYRLHLANEVVVGHLEERIAWPSEDFTPVYQGVGDYLTEGKPKDVARCLK